ncbi:MAG: hypothetical protein OEV37_01235 [Candidatus Berkelbacteria bacterium]|nr:hypothetical protein [Candidatus Berkelbacteria bacterium]
MTEKFFIAISIFLVLLGVELVIIFNTSPLSSSPVTKAGFFLFGVGALSALIFFFTLLYQYISKKTTDGRFINTALRRSILTAILIGGIGAFSALNVINFISILSFLLALLLIEIFFSMQGRHPKT